MTPHGMNFDELCEFSDFGSLITIDISVGRPTFKTGLGFTPVMTRSDRSKIKLLINQLKNNVQPLHLIWQSMQNVSPIKHFFSDKNPEQIAKIVRHSQLFLECLSPDSLFSIERCNKYPSDENEGVKVMSKRTIKKGMVIKGLEICMSKRNNKQLKSLTDRGKNYLFDNKLIGLGPAAFINHSCNPNVELVWAVKGSIQKVKTLREVGSGTEILMSYRPNYFGDDCLCDVCQG